MELKHIRRGEGGGDEAMADHFAAAVQLLAAAVEPPVLEVVLGGGRVDGLYNPMPVLWVARSRSRVSMLGLCSGVVWT